MQIKDISEETLSTWGRLSPKSSIAWVKKIALLLSVLILPWAFLPWRFALLYVLIALFISNEVEDAVPVIVALTKQELRRSPESQA